MHSTTLREYQMQERQLRSTLEMIKRFAVGFQAGRDEVQIQVRMGMLDDSLNKFYVVRRKIDVLTDAAGLSTTAQEKEQIVEHSEVIWEFENLYCEVKAMLQQLQPKPVVTTVPGALGAAASTSATVSTCRVKLPEIKLPTFSGELEGWITFRDTFRSLIHNNPNLSPIDRFTYLRTSLSGEALQEIGAVDITGANYEVAWNLLEKRFENKRLILKTHLDAVFAIEPMAKESFDALNYVLSTFEKNLQMIQKLGVETSDWSILLAHILMSKLDTTTLRHWEMHYNSREYVKYNALVEYLRDHCAVLRSIAPVVKANTVERDRQPKHASSYALSVESRNCYFCEGSQHNPFQCDALRRMNAADRLSTARKNQLCFNCLNAGHTGDKCTRGFCTLCKRKHHTLLHECFVGASNQAATATVPTDSARPQPANQQNSQPQQLTPQSHDRNTPTQTTQQNTSTFTQDTAQPTTLNTTTCNHSYTLTPSTADQSREVLLPTAIVRIRDAQGRMVSGRALLDSGSQKNLMTEEFAQKLNCKLVPDYLMVKGVGTAESRSSSAVIVTVCPRLSTISQFSESMKFHLLPTVTANLPVNHVNSEQLSIPQDVTLADPHFYHPGAIDMLIGAEFYHRLLSDGRLKRGNAHLTFQSTLFGWIVAGVVDDETNRLPRDVTNVSASTEAVQEVQDLLTKCWELEPSSAFCLMEKLLQIIDEEELAIGPEAAEAYSSLSVLTGSVARVRRLVYSAQCTDQDWNQTGFITFAEHEAALLTLAQSEGFAEELSALEEGRAVKKSSRIRSLNPKLVDGVVLVGGRQCNTSEFARQKYPIILDHHHPLTKIIIRHYHQQYSHLGLQALIACVRERFWPLNIRRAVKQVIHECVACSWHNPNSPSARGNRRIQPVRGFIYASPVRLLQPNVVDVVAHDTTVTQGARSLVTRNLQRTGHKSKGFHLESRSLGHCDDNLPVSDGEN